MTFYHKGTAIPGLSGDFIAAALRVVPAMHLYAGPVVRFNSTSRHAWGDPATPVGDAGIKVGEIIAWRCWEIGTGRLRSVTGAVWEPGKPMMGDVKTDGIHAWKTLDGARQYANEACVFGVLGTVALWGDVIEHEDGYRAEFAKVVSIDLGTGGGSMRVVPLDVIRELRRAYGVPGGERKEPTRSAVPAVWLGTRAKARPWWKVWGR